jgi:hypothetical protein
MISTFIQYDECYHWETNHIDNDHWNSYTIRLYEYLPSANIHLRWLPENQSTVISISTLLKPSPISVHLNTLIAYWVIMAWNTNMTVITVTHTYLLNCVLSLINMTAYNTVETPISKTGINATHKTLRYAILSNILSMEVSIISQSNDRNMPEEFPACSADVRTSNKYDGILRL